MSARDMSGQLTGGWKAQIHEKTLYDPSIISDEKYLQWGREAAAEAQAAGRLTREWFGFTSEGVKIRGYLDNHGAVKSFFPEFQLDRCQKE